MLTTTVTNTFVASDAAGNGYTINEYAPVPDGLPQGPRSSLRTPDGRTVEVTGPGLYCIPTLGLELELDLVKSVH